MNVLYAFIWLEKNQRPRKPKLIRRRIYCCCCYFFTRALYYLYILFGFVVDHCKIRRRCPVNVCFGDITLLHFIILCNFVSWVYIIIILYMYRETHRASANELHSSPHETHPDTSLLSFNLCVYSNILICASE